MHYHSKNKANWGIDQNYKDLDGNTKSFTVINHDPKPTMNMYNPTQEEKKEVQLSLSEYKKSLQDYILGEHASLCPTPLQPTFIIRGENINEFKWNVKAVTDEGVSLDTLRDLSNLVQRRKELYT